MIPDVSLKGMDRHADILLLNTSNLWELYPTQEALALRSLERTPDGVGLVLQLETAFELGHLEVTGAGDAEVSVNGNAVTVRFLHEDTLEPAGHDLAFIAVATTGERTKPHRMALQYASKARDASNGRTGRNRILVKATDLQLAYSRVDDWIIETPTDDDRTYAQSRWGTLIADAASPYDRARAVIRAVIDDFEPQRGTPSDVMNGLHPFRQHERILAGIDHGWCANLAEVLCHALNSLEVPCRLIRMRHTYYNADSDEPGRNFEVLLAGGHTVAEIFDATRNQWIWLDPSQRQLGARDAGGHWLSFAELHHRVNLPHQAADLRLDGYDPATKTVTTYAFADSPVRSNLLHFAKREQRIYYFKKR